MSHPLRIAIVTGSSSRLAGGLFNSVRNSALSIAAEDHKVSVFSLNDAHAEEDAGAWTPLTPNVSKTFGPQRLGYSRSFSKSLKTTDFDCIHQHGIWQAFSRDVAGWRKRTNRPTMVSPRGMLDTWALKNSGWKKRLAAGLFEKQNLTNTTCIHALNASEAQSIRDFGLVNPIATIPNGTTLPDLPGDQKSTSPDLWPNDKKVLLFIARLHPKKGVFELINAWAKFSRNAPEAADAWHLVIAGWDEGGHNDLLLKSIAQNEVGGSVSLVGPKFGDQKDAILRRANAFILPSYSEGLPMGILEAWAYQLPVLMTEACNIPAGFEREAAIKIGTDPVELSKSLEDVLSLPDEHLRDMGRNGRKLVEEQFTWPEIARRHIEVYRWMVDGCSPQEKPSCVEVN